MGCVQPATEKQSYLCVQALRGFAACMVLIHHSAFIWMSKVAGGPHSIRANGAAGVDIFFVISGFVMVISTSGRKTPAAGQFLTRRLIRIVPLYWLLTFAALADGFVKQAVRHSAVPSLPHVLSSLFFLPYKQDGDLSVILVAGWTLSFEMFFYLLFSIAIYYGLPRFRFLAAIMIPLGLIGIFHQSTWPAFTFFLNPILLEFLGGVLIANAVLRGWKPRPGLIAVSGIAGLVLLLGTPNFDTSAPSARALVWGVPAFMVVGAVVFLESRFPVRVPRFMLVLGDASYSLYLLHGFVIQVLMIAFLKAHAPFSVAPVFLSLVLVISVPCACLLYRFFELPVGQKLRKWVGSESSRMAPNVQPETA